MEYKIILKSKHVILENVLNTAISRLPKVLKGPLLLKTKGVYYALCEVSFTESNPVERDLLISGLKKESGKYAKIFALELRKNLEKLGHVIQIESEDFDFSQENKRKTWSRI